MKLTSISVRNFQMLLTVHLEPCAPVLIVAGGNEQGKSSLLEAVRAALTGETTRVRMKKDLPEIVRDGAASGAVAIGLGDGTYAEFSLPDGTHVAPRGLSHAQSMALPLVLDSPRFAAMSADERRTVLFALAGQQCDSAVVAAKLITRGHNNTLVESIAPLLRSGFPAAAEEARGRAREAKAAWKSVTSETWGEKKGAAWKPPALPDDAANAAARAENANVRIAETSEQVSVALQELEAAQAAHAQLEKDTALRAELQEQVEREERIRAKLALDEAGLRQWEEKVSATRAAASPASALDSFGFGVGAELTRVMKQRLTAPASALDSFGIGLLRGLASVTDEFVTIARDNPGLFDDELIHRASVHLDEFKKMHGWPHSTSTKGLADPDAAARLPEYEQALTLMQSAVANDRRDLAAAELAAAKVRDLDSRLSTPPPAIEPLQQRVTELVDTRKAWIDDADKYRAIAAQFAERDAVAAKARAHHNDVQDWTTIAEALDPSGIPSEMLGDALKPFNDRLRATAMATGWEQVVIDHDAQVRVGERAYGLKSASARWRADAALADAISHVSGLRMFALDGCDILDVTTHRAALLKWLHGLASRGEIDSVLVTGTFKQRPSLPAATFDIAWIEHGEVAAPPAIAA